METIYLNRMLITGPVNTNTPLIAIKEILDAHSIGDYDEDRFDDLYYLTRIIDIINTKQTKKVLKPYAKEDLRLIARFINKDAKWKVDELTKAFNFLISFFETKKLQENIKNVMNIETGLQTPGNPYRYNACLLYAICKSNNIRTSSNSTMREMVDNIKLLFLLKNPHIHHQVRNQIYQSVMYGTIDGHQLINMLTSIDSKTVTQLLDNHNNNNDIDLCNYSEDDINSPYVNPLFEWVDREVESVVNYDNLIETSNRIHNQDIHILPRNNLEAIAMAAIYYKMDIRDVAAPLSEYMELLRTPYFPIDRCLANRLRESSIHPGSLLNPRLDIVFNPNLPLELYDMEDLKRMVVEEGYKVGNILIGDNPYTILQMAYLLPTFLHGKQGNIINDVNTLYDDIDELDYNDVVIYGLRDNDFKAYTYEELYESFHIFKRFQDPQSNREMFLEESVNKLYIMCQLDQRVGESRTTFNNRIALSREIETVKLYLETNQELVKEFVDRYDVLELDDKIRLENILVLLLESAMYMRSWDGEGDYPLRSSDTLVQYDQQGLIDIRVTESIRKLEQEIEQLNDLNELGNLFKELPLMFYNNSGNFIPSTSEDEGYSIYDRIFIVKGGEDGTIQSCMRLSSNRFCATAYYYMRLIGMDLPFNIDEVSYIS